MTFNKNIRLQSVVLVLDSIFNIVINISPMFSVICTTDVKVCIERLHLHYNLTGARCSSVVRAFAHGAMGRQIDPSWWTH